MNSERWLRISTIENAVDNIEMTAHILATVESEMRWKWVIIALHQALYGFAVESIWGTSASSVLKDPADDESYVIGIWEAIERAKDPRWMTRTGSRPLTVSDEEDWAISLVCKHFRNEFEHFGVKRWSIELSGISQAVASVVGVIRRLALDCSVIQYPSDQDRERVVRAFDVLSMRLRETAT